MNTDPNTWTTDEYEAFVMLIAAESDLELALEEKRSIMAKAGERWNDLLNHFRSMNDIERLDVLLVGRAQHLPTAADQERLLDEVRAVFEADSQYADIERGVMSILRKLI